MGYCKIFFGPIYFVCLFGNTITKTSSILIIHINHSLAKFQVFVSCQVDSFTVFVKRPLLVIAGELFSLFYIVIA